MHGDIERNTFQQAKHFSRLYRQQGRVDVPADWNEQADIAAHRVETEAADVIGTCGGPKHQAAFAIRGGNSGDFTVGAGRYYIDGILCENEQEAAFTRQPDYRPDPIREPGQYLVYLDVWRRPITAIEDPQIREVALGGPDTTTRAKTVWQVKLLRVGELNDDIRCSTDLSAWNSLTQPSDATLMARAQPSPVPDSVCLLPQTAGYRGLGNQLYRVEIHRGGSINSPTASTAATFKWSRENGSITAAVDGINADRITLTSSRPGGRLDFAPGEWIELLDDRNDWNRRPGPLVLINHVDELVLTVDTSRGIDPDTGGVGPVTLTVNPDLHPKIRRWENAGKGLAVREAKTGGRDGFLPLEDGVEVKFGGGRCATGDYWLIPARTNTRDVEWHKDAAEKPHGIDHHLCRLAVIRYDGGKVTLVEDCRRLFPPLTEIDDRCGCCTVTVGESPSADYPSIQEAVTALRETGGQICLLPGRHVGQVVIDRCHDLFFKGCGRRSRVVSVQRETDAPLTDPVFHILNSRNIRIEGLEVSASPMGPGILVENTLPDDPATDVGYATDQIQMVDLFISAGTRCAIEVHRSTRVTVQNSEIEMLDPHGREPAIFLQATEALVESNQVRGSAEINPSRFTSDSPADVSGLQIAGGSRHVCVRGNRFTKLTGQGILLGHMEELEESNPVGRWRPLIARAAFALDPCADCHPPTAPLRPSGRLPHDGGLRVKRTIPLPLDEIRIERNQMLETGLDGIGVVGFFDLDSTAELVRVRRLSIIGNEIRQCASRPPAPTPSALVDQMGYGAVTLADVEDLVIRDNLIESNGANHQGAVCGVFVLSGTGVEISGNRLLGNGSPPPMTPGVAIDPEVVTPRRGGIHIVHTVAPARVPRLAKAGGSGPSGMTYVPASVPTGLPALRVHDNIVNSPAGPALHATGLGSMSVAGNQFSCTGLAPRSPGLFSPSTVFIMNLGTSMDLTQETDRFSRILAREKLSVPVVSFANLHLRMAGGDVLFTNNQCSLRLTEGASDPLFASIVLASLDDIAFENNHSTCHLPRTQDLVVANTIVYAPTVRVVGNRIKEPLSQAAYSLWTVGLMNVTTHNQTTHCLHVAGAETTDVPNQVSIATVSSGQKYCAPNLLATLRNRQSFVNLLNAL